jgi:hypothetical protein
LEKKAEVDKFPLVELYINELLAGAYGVEKLMGLTNESLVV